MKVGDKVKVIAFKAESLKDQFRDPVGRTGKIDHHVGFQPVDEFGGPEELAWGIEWDFTPEEEANGNTLGMFPDIMLESELEVIEEGK